MALSSRPAKVIANLADWLSSSQRHVVANSPTAFVGHDALGVDELHADLHRFVFLLGQSDGEQLFGEHAT